MMLRKAILWLLVLALLIIGAAWSWHAYQRRAQEKENPYNRPGTVWTSALLPVSYGSDLILLNDGSYAAVTVCDVCMSDDFSFGTWREQGGTITLTPLKNKSKRYTLIKELHGHCQFLIDKTPDMKFHPTFAVKDNEACIMQFIQDDMARFEKEWRKKSQSRP